MRRAATLIALALAGCASIPAPVPAPSLSGTIAHPSAVTLTWSPVTTLTDHSPLTDLKGYALTYGPSNASTGQLTTLEPATVTQLTLPLAKGKWSFSVAAISASHGTGLQSNIVTANVP